MLKTQVGVLILALSMGFSTMVWAEDDEEYSNYENIVSELKADTKNIVVNEIQDPWEQISIYGGLGLVTSFVSVNLPATGNQINGLLKGIEGHFGIDLFTKTLRAEGAFRAYAQEAMSQRTQASLKEFELRGVFVPAPYQKNIFRLGLGVAARYLDVKSQSALASESYTNATPTALVMMGLERKVSRNVFVGPDLTYHSSLVDDSIEKYSWNLALKMNASF